MIGAQSLYSQFRYRTPWCLFHGIYNTSRPPADNRTIACPTISISFVKYVSIHGASKSSMLTIPWLKARTIVLLHYQCITSSQRHHTNQLKLHFLLDFPLILISNPIRETCTLTRQGLLQKTNPTPSISSPAAQSRIHSTNLPLPAPSRQPPTAPPPPHLPSPQQQPPYQNILHPQHFLRTQPCHCHLPRSSRHSQSCQRCSFRSLPKARLRGEILKPQPKREGERYD